MNENMCEPEKEVDIRRVIGQLSELEYEADKCRQLFRQREQVLMLTEKVAELEVVNHELRIAATTSAEERDIKDNKIRRLESEVAARESVIKRLKRERDSAP